MKDYFVYKRVQNQLLQRLGALAVYLYFSDVDVFIGYGLKCGGIAETLLNTKVKNPFQ